MTEQENICVCPQLYIRNVICVMCMCSVVSNILSLHGL